MYNHFVGTLGSIYRYPVKSMAGESLTMVYLERFGMAFDRSYAVVDLEGGILANAKNQTQWPHMYSYYAQYMDTSPVPGHAPHVCITLPDGSTVQSSDHNAHERLSEVFGREVVLKSAVQGCHSTAFGSFVDVAPIHLVTHSSINMLPGPSIGVPADVARLRPSLVINTGKKTGFVENIWVACEIEIGTAVLRITERTRRCSRITLPQPSSGEDPHLLRFVQQANGGTLGVYAEIIKPGLIRCGDTVCIKG